MSAQALTTDAQVARGVVLTAEKAKRKRNTARFLAAASTSVAAR